MCVCPGPSFTLVCLSLLPCARYWCARQTAGQDRTRKDTHTHISLSLNARSQSDDAPLHILSLCFLFLSTSLEPSQRTTT